MIEPDGKQERAPGIYIYCRSKEEKERVKRMARNTRRSLSDYCMGAILKQLEEDELKGTNVFR